MKSWVIYNKFIPVKGFTAMTILWWIFVRKEHKAKFIYRGRLHRHEQTHSVQQVELMVLACIITPLLIWLTSSSWWFLFAIPVFPIAVYVFCWLVELALPPYNHAYKNVCFETEALLHQNEPDYLHIRSPFSFLQYISNRKYPVK